MRILACIIISLGIAFPAPGAGREDAVTKDIEKIADALKSNQLALIIEMTHPPILEAMGGKEKALAAVREFLDSSAASGFKVQRFDVIPPLTFLEGDEYHYVIVPFSLMTEFQGLKIRSHGYQLGVRKKTSDEWKYVDGQKLNDAMFDMYFPDFPDRSKLPEVKKEVVED